MQIHPTLFAKMSAAKQQLFPVIIYSKKTIYEIRDHIVRHYGPIKYELPFIDAVAVELSRDKIDELAQYQSIRLITDDALVSKASPLTDHSRPAQKERPAPETLFYQRASRKDSHKKHGLGVGVAVIDTGIAPHWDLIFPKNRIIAFTDFINHRQTPYDDDGHGTHVAGILAGNGFSSGKYMGTAPCANLIGIKALDHNGNGTTSDILAALQWTINNRKRYNIRVINLSLGIDTEDSYEEDPLIRGANAAVAYGLTIVAAAGNTGPKEGTINSPGTSPFVITVGAADLEKCTVARFSSRGPTPDGLPKPDLLGPGVDVISLDAKNPKGYLTESGTSMAAPVISGAAACLYAKHPMLTPPEVKEILLSTVFPLNNEPSNAQGKGVLNYQLFFEL